MMSGDGRYGRVLGPSLTESVAEVADELTLGMRSPLEFWCCRGAAFEEPATEHAHEVLELRGEIYGLRKSICRILCADIFTKLKLPATKTLLYP